MYGWSKWGGRRMGTVKEELDEWFCQGCGRKQIKELPAYLLPQDEDMREYVRVCSECKNLVVSYQLDQFDELIKLIRKPDDLLEQINKVANLLTY